MGNIIVDTHCHLSDDDYENLNEIITNMGNNIMIVSGSDVKSNLKVIELCNKYNNIYGTIGYHPECADDVTDEDFIILEKALSNNKIVGVGEIGLDYHYSNLNKEKQKKVFMKQIEVALKHKKSIVVHSRDAALDTYDILKDVKEINIVLHCYSGSLEMALDFTKMGVFLGIGGVITFKNASKLVEVVKSINLKYLVLETDSPYLSPEPFRSKKNEPFNVVYVGKKVAEIKDVSYDEVVKITTENAVKIFGIDV